MLPYSDLDMSKIEQPSLEVGTDGIPAKALQRHFWSLPPPDFPGAKPDSRVLIMNCKPELWTGVLPYSEQAVSPKPRSVLLLTNNSSALSGVTFGLFAHTQTITEPRRTLQGVHCFGALMKRKDGANSPLHIDNTSTRISSQFLPMVPCWWWKAGCQDGAFDYAVPPVMI